MVRPRGRRLSVPGDDSDRYQFDLLLVRRARAGIRRDVTRLVRRLEGLRTLLSSLNRKTGMRLRSDDLDDVHQEVWVRIWAKLDSYRGTGSVEAWAGRYCVFVFMNRLRRTVRARAIETNLPEDLLSAAWVRRRAPIVDSLDELLDEVGAPEADIIRRKHLRSLSFARIARDLDIPVGTVKSRYYRGLKRLRVKLPVIDEESADPTCAGRSGFVGRGLGARASGKSRARKRFESRRPPLG